MFRTRLSVTVLESRENPSGPELAAPIESPCSTEPVDTAPPPSDTSDTIIDIGTAIVGGATDTTTSDTSTTDTSLFASDF